MVRVRWSDSASEQLRDLTAYIAQDNPLAAEQIKQRLLALAQSLSTFPNRGRPGLENGTREMPTVPPYVMTYEVTRDEVIILDVRHGRQMPRRLTR